MTQEIDARIYEEITDLDEMKSTIEEYLEDYNSITAAQMPLVMFLDACEHASRTYRVLGQPAGNVLLLGVGGSGRQSLTRLATYMSGVGDIDCFQIQVIKGYGMTDFKEDLKKCLMVCGVEDKVNVFLFCDTQIVEKTFVEAINNVLNSGDVPNLYAEEDFGTIATACRKFCQELGMQPTKANLFGAYLTRVKKNLHVVLAFSPVGDTFRNLLRSFPSLVNCCTIDWFHEWPAEALVSVAKQQMTAQNIDLPDLESTLTMFKGIHQSVEHAALSFLKSTHRNVYITPTSYLELLSGFVKVLADTRKATGLAQMRYANGLTKIEDAEGQVAGLQQMLIDKKPSLEKTKQEVSDMMVVITKDKADAEEVSTAVAKEEAEAQVKADATQAIKDDAQKDLDEALPALEVATQCLKKLSKAHINEVKSFGDPATGVRLACEGICIMFGIKGEKKADPNNPSQKILDFWDVSKKQVLNNPDELLKQLFDFDKDNIPDKIIRDVAPLMEKDEFLPENVKKSFYCMRGALHVDPSNVQVSFRSEGCRTQARAIERSGSRTRNRPGESRSSAG
jgi:dynein heavy chain